MTIDMWIAIGLFVWVFVALIWHIADPIIVGISIPVVLSLTKIVNPNQAFADFANTTVIFFMSMLVLGAAIFKTGLADFIGTAIINMVGKTEKKLTLSVAIVASSISAFLNDTGTTGCLMPIAGAMAKKANVKVSKIYMPLAFFASLGGTITLVGTTPHIVAGGLLQKAGFQPFGFFEFAKIGLPLTLLGLIYMYFWGRHLLPAHDSEYEKTPVLAKRNNKGMVITSLVFFIVILSMASNIMPFHLAAVIGAMVVIVTGCITVKEAMDAFSMPTLFLVAGIFPLSTALVKTGAAALIVQTVSGLAAGLHPLAAIMMITGLTTFLTQFMMGTSLTAIMVPLGILMAQSLGLNPRGVVMAIAIAASLAFCTPFGTGPNLLVWKPGNYEIKDYFKVGLPIVTTSWLVTALIVYYVYH